MQVKPAIQRCRAILVLLSWLFMTLFSCAALSNSPDSSQTLQSPDSAHHQGMEMTAAEHSSMPCCEQLLDQACCDDVTALHSSGFGSIDPAKKIEIKWPLLITLATAESVCLPQHWSPVGTLAPGQGPLPSYPRLHLLNCTFLD